MYHQAWHSALHILPTQCIYHTFHFIVTALWNVNWLLCRNGAQCVLCKVRTECCTLTQYICVGRDTAVGIGACFGLDGPAIESRWGRYFSRISRQALGPTQIPIEWAPDSFSGGKEAGTWRCLYLGARGGAVGWGTALQAGRSWVRFQMLSLEFFIDVILPAALWPWSSLSL
jgi:hypothetical protein